MQDGVANAGFPCLLSLPSFPSAREPGAVRTNLHVDDLEVAVGNLNVCLASLRIVEGNKETKR